MSLMFKVLVTYIRKQQIEADYKQNNLVNFLQ